MKRGKIEFDDPTFKPHPAKVKAGTVSGETALVAALLDALETAPHKHRIDFQPYWDWYDGPRAEVVARARVVLNSAG